MSHSMNYNDLLYTNTFTNANPVTQHDLENQVANPSTNIDFRRQYPGIRRHNEVDIREFKSTKIHMDDSLKHRQWISLNVDSRYRDYLRFPNSNKYRYYFKRPIRNVYKMSLSTAEVPFSDFLIKLGNAFIDFTVDDVPNTTLHAQMEEGDYDDDSFASEVENALQFSASEGGSSITFTVSISSGVLRIQADQGFSLLFQSGCHADVMTGYNDTTQSGTSYGQLLRNPGTSNLGDRTVHQLLPPSVTALDEDSQYICGNTELPLVEGSGSARTVMGFNWEDYCSITIDGSEVVVAPNRTDLCGERYILLKLEQDGRDISMVDSYYDTSDTFAKIQRYPDNCSVAYFKENQDTKYERIFYPPVDKMSYVDITFLTGQGDTYNFRGLENSFTLRMETIAGNVNAMSESTPHA